MALTVSIYTIILLIFTVLMLPRVLQSPDTVSDAFLVAAR